MTSAKTTRILPLLLAALALACHVNQPDTSFYHATTSVPHLIRSSQPRGQAELSATGVIRRGHCVDYRLSADGEGGVWYWQESEWAVELGCAFVGDPTIRYPITSAEQVQDVVARVHHELEAGNDVLVHCKRGKDRTGAVVAGEEIEHTTMTRAEVFHERNLYLSEVDKALDIEQTAVLADIARQAGK